MATNTRISEVTGLMVKHFDPTTRTIRIERRNWRGDIDAPKTEAASACWRWATSATGTWTGSPNSTGRGPKDWIFPQASDPAKPMWDSGIRKALHEAAQEAGCDFPGLGPHSFRRANITWRQEVGGTPSRRRRSRATVNSI